MSKVTDEVWLFAKLSVCTDAVSNSQSFDFNDFLFQLISAFCQDIYPKRTILSDITAALFLKTLILLLMLEVFTKLTDIATS